MEILCLAYLILSYWAIGKVWYSKRVYIVHDTLGFYIGRFFFGVLLGWILIPIALLMKLAGK